MKNLTFEDLEKAMPKKNGLTDEESRLLDCFCDILKCITDEIMKMSPHGTAAYDLFKAKLALDDARDFMHAAKAES